LTPDGLFFKNCRIRKTFREHRTEMKKCIAVAALFLLVCLTALAQERPKTEVFVGYSYARLNPSVSGQPSFSVNGGNASVAHDVMGSISLVGDFSGYHVGKIGNAGADVDLYTFLFGPRYSYRDNGRIIPFAQVLVGGITSTFGAVPLNSFVGNRAGGFAMTVGGGVDAKFGDHLAFRLIQSEYFLTRFDEPLSARPGGPIGPFLGVFTVTTKATQNNLRLATGIVLRF